MIVHNGANPNTPKKVLAPMTPLPTKFDAKKNGNDLSIPAFLVRKKRSEMTPEEIKADDERKARDKKSQESAMAKIKAEAKTKRDAPKEAKPKGKTKLSIVADLLKRKNGCLRSEVLETCKWPAVSMQAMAKSAGLRLRTEKEGGHLRYFGF